MFVFWIAATLLCAGAGMLVFRGAARVGPALAEDPGLAVHRRQLSEIDELAERGLLAADERRAARAEAGRRLLDAADQAAAAPVASTKSNRALVFALGAGAPLLAVALYATVAGAPGTADQPFLKRVAAWQAKPDALGPQQMAAVLTTIVAKNPGNPEALKKLGMAQLWAGDAPGAQSSLRRSVSIAPNDPEAWVLLGEAFSRDTGTIGTDAAFALGKARDIAATRADRARIEAAITAVEDSVKPQAQAASDQAAMIQGMVDGLAVRLKTNPDDSNGWVRLVKAYSVLGDTARRDAALTEARRRCADKPDILKALTEAAEPPR